MIGVDEAWGLVAAQASPLEPEDVGLADAAGRVLAEPVLARFAMPRSDVSVMDGYAVRADDLTAGTWRIIGSAYPGIPFAGSVAQGQCVRVFTGAPIPAGAHRVLVQEIVTRDADSARLAGEFGPATHVRAAGSDFAEGDVLVPAGRVLNAGALVAAAGADRASVTVWRRPRVALLATGDELVEAGTAAERADTIPESVGFGVAALVDNWGGTIVRRRHAPDRLDAITDAAALALGEADVLVMTGGASVGEKDFARQALESVGLHLIFSKVAMRPGKPVWFGRVGARLVIGLPGNPTSALVTARLFLAPLVAGLSGRAPLIAAAWTKAPLTTGIGPCDARETFSRGRWSGNGVEPLRNQDSGSQRALADSDVLIRQRPGTGAVTAGGIVDILAL